MNTLTDSRSRAVRTCIAPPRRPEQRDAATPSPDPPSSRLTALAAMWINASPGEPISAGLGARVGALAYGVLCYAVFFATFLYAAGWIGGFLTPTTLDGPRTMPLAAAIGINLALLLAFAVQHSVMARPWFKAWWTRYVPPVAERSTYVLFSSVAMIAMFIFWQPMGGVVWDFQSPILRIAAYSVLGAGLLIVLAATCLINHFDLFGLRQVWLYFRGRGYTHLRFATPGPYRMVRHPLYVGWLLTFWGTPTMTWAHLLFAAVTTIYIVAAIRWEEHDLIEAHPEYAAYREKVPMLVPRVL